MPTNQNRDAVYIRNLDGYTAFAYPPVYIKATTENIPARFDGAEFSKDEAETLARTIAPHLFETPDINPLQAIYDDLQETETSYSNELAASVDEAWVSDDVQNSMGTLLSALRHTLRQMQELLPSE